MFPSSKVLISHKKLENLPFPGKFNTIDFITQLRDDSHELEI